LIIYLIINIKKYYLSKNINKMAKAKTSTNSSVKSGDSKVKRPCVHSKSKSSKLKTSKNYLKKSVGQGKKR
jgi:hypothetical protein